MVAPSAPEGKTVPCNSMRAPNLRERQRPIQYRFQDLRNIWVSYAIALLVPFLAILSLYAIVVTCINSFTPVKSYLAPQSSPPETYGVELTLLERQFYNKNVPKLMKGLTALARGPLDERKIVDLYSKQEYGIGHDITFYLELFVLGNKNVTCHFVTDEIVDICLAYEEKEVSLICEDENSCPAVDKLAEHALGLKEVPMIIKTYIRNVFANRIRCPAMRCILLRKVVNNLAKYSVIKIPDDVCKIKPVSQPTDIPATQKTPDEISPEDLASASDHMVRMRHKYELLLKAGALRAIREELEVLAKKFSYYRRKYPDIIIDTRHFRLSKAEEKMLEDEVSEGKLEPLTTPGRMEEEAKHSVGKSEPLITPGRTEEEAKHSVGKSEPLTTPGRTEEEAKHIISKRSAPRKGATNAKKRTSSTARPTTQQPTTLNVDASTAIPEPTVKHSPTEPFKDGDSSTRITTQKPKDELLVTTTAAKTGETLTTTTKPGKILDGKND